MPAFAALPISATIQEVFPLDDLLTGLLAVATEGIILSRPVWDTAQGTLIDLELLLLNDAAQQQLQLPASPTLTYTQLYPQATTSNILAFCHTVFESGQAGPYNVDAPIDGLNNQYQLIGRRAGQGLLLSFTSRPKTERTVVEQALRDSQAREQLARADAETQRNQLHRLFMEAPAMITMFEGPNHVFKLVNPKYQQLVGPRPILGKPIAEAMPELAGQPIFDLLNNVYRTGESFYATEMLVQLDHGNLGRLGQNYYNFVYQPTHNETGAVDGIQVFAYEVTAQVLARRHLEETELQLRALNDELATANEELQAANEEIRANNDALFSTQHELRQLNQELEKRVTYRTQELQLAQAEAERQRGRLERLFMQAPGAICILDGPDLIFELVNPAYQQLFPGRYLRGRSLDKALPELRYQPIWEILQNVYHTGETFQGEEILMQIARHEDALPEDIYFNFIYQARYNAQGQIDGIIVFAYEVTTQVVARQAVAKANEGLQATNQQLVRINQDLDNFVYTASHDLKQPINNMAGIFEELTRTAYFRDPEAPLLLDMFERALGQIYNTIQDMAEVVQLERQQSQLPLERVMLLPLVQEVMQSMNGQIVAANAVFELNFTELPAVSLARLNLQSIYYNLLSNALKYAHPDRLPVVHLRSQLTTTGHALLTVQDNGLGLDIARYGSDLFQMFRRFHDHVTGSGIGLYLVNRIVQQAGGHIEVDSAVGIGTTFRIYLPVGLPDNATEQPQ